MMLLERAQLMSVEEFLDFAESSEGWHEFIDGKLYPMTTAASRHNIISYNIASRLGARLAEHNCLVLGMGQGIRVSEERFFIPDVCVVCGDPLLETDSRILLNPILVAEVTSPTTASLDRGLKCDSYLNVPSIEIYLIVDQQRVFTELYSRGGAGWHREVYDSLDDEIALESLGCALALREIYRDVVFEEGS